MTQHINFLKSFPKTKVELPAWMIAVIVLAVLIACVIQSLFAGYMHMQEKQQLQAVQAEQANVLNDLQQLLQANPILAEDKPLAERVGDLEKLLREKQVQFAILTHTTFRRPFSSYLHTLSNHAPQGLWLTSIKIDQDSNDVSITGNSVRPVFVTVFMDALQTAPAFKDVVFDLFYVHKIKGKNYVEFEIANDKLKTYHPGSKNASDEEDTKESREKAQ